MGQTILFNDHPLVIPVELAAAVGLNEAIMLQQVHYWCVQNKRLRQNKKDGCYWTYNSLKEWQKQFPFWSERTIQRTIKTLEKEGFLISGQYNRMKMDRTKWYRVDMERLSGAMDKAAELAEKEEAEKERLRRKGKLMIEACQGAGSTVEYTDLLAEKTGREIEKAQKEKRISQEESRRVI